MKATLAIYSILLFTGLTQAVVAITTSAFSCRTVCCRRRNNAGTVIFAPVNADPRSVTFTLNTVNTVNTPAPTQETSKPEESRYGKKTHIRWNSDRNRNTN